MSYITDKIKQRSQSVGTAPSLPQVQAPVQQPTAPIQAQPQQPQVQAQSSNPLFNFFRKANDVVSGISKSVGQVGGNFVRGLPTVRTPQDIGNAFAGVGKELLNSTVVPIAKFGVESNPVYRVLPKKQQEKVSKPLSYIQEKLKPQGSIQETGGNIGRLMALALGSEVGGAAVSPLVTSLAGKALPLTSSVLGGTAAGQLDVRPGENRLKRAATDAATIAAIGLLGKGASALKNNIVNKVEGAPNTIPSDVTAPITEPQATTQPQNIQPKPFVNPKDIKGQTVYRGTIGDNEINNILNGKADYNATSNSDIWTSKLSEAKGYAEGASMVNGVNEFPVGSNEGLKNYVLQGKQLADGKIIPLKATNIYTNETIDLLNPQAALDPVQKIQQILPEIAKQRSAQEALYTKARAERFAKAQAAGEAAGGGQATVQAQLGSLKGELPKVDYSTLNLQQSDVDHLFNMIQQSDSLPTFTDKLPASSGLLKVLGQSDAGVVPNNTEIFAMKKVFGADFTNTVLDNRTTLQKVVQGAGDVLNIPKAVMASTDLSAPLRQGGFLAPSYPKEFGKSYKDMFKYAVSQGAYDDSLKAIAQRPTYSLMQESGLDLTDMVSKQEERFLTSLPEKVPGYGAIYKGSERAYTGFLNQFRADVFDSMVKDATDQGVALDAVAKNGKTIAENIAGLVNNGTGRGELPNFLKSSSQILNAITFSPKMLASRIALANPAYYIKLDPFTRKQAVTSLLKFSGTAATILGLAAAAGAKVSTDWRNTDFLKVKVGNTRYDLLTGFQQLAVLLGREVTGQMISSTTGKQTNLGEGYKPPTRGSILWNFFKNKESPATSLASDLLTGQDRQGKPLNVPAAVLDRFIPLLFSDAYDSIKSNGLAKGSLMALPAAFGVGVQTYGDQIPTKVTSQTGKTSIKFQQTPGLTEDIINALTGTKVSNIPQNQWGPLLKKQQLQNQKDTEISNAKLDVLQTGKPKTVNGTYIYLQDGVVRTRKVSK